MSLEVDLHGKLSSSTATTGIAGSKIFQNFVPQNTDFPAVTFSRDGEVPFYAMVSDPALQGARFEFSVWSTSASQGKAIAVGLKNALRDFSGYLSGTSSSISVQRIFYEGMNSNLLVDEDMKQVSHQYLVDFIVYSTEE